MTKSLFKKEFWANFIAISIVAILSTFVVVGLLTLLVKFIIVCFNWIF